MDACHANRLIHETSPYLLQHAHNPVDWYPWGDEAFQKAVAENKPILLSIGYSACHWCHVMERESFEDEKIAALMNELFVNIKVDREERPDLDEIYMSAVQMLTGRGGWPMTLFLTPDRKPFYGGTYFPPEDRGGMPGFPRILTGVAQAYRDKPQDVAKSVEQILENLQRMAQSPGGARPFAPEIISNSVAAIARAYDAEHGGLGQAPKFPNPGAYELFLRDFHRTKSQRSLEMATHTLTKMARGGIYDHLGGGFHRYSTDAKWLVPHFEKMLYDNAQLVRCYAQAYQVTGEALFKQVVEESVGYLLREMFHSEGGFYSTQDADSEGVEGKFFVWTPAEINELVGADDGEIFNRMYDVTDEGNFEDKNILHPILTVVQASKFFRKTQGEIEQLVARVKQRLFIEREKRIKPFRDEKIITAWNGLMMSGLAEAIKIAPKQEYIDSANRTVQFFFSRMFRDGFLLHSYKDGHAKVLGFLDDYASFAVGLLDLHEATFERHLLGRAVQLADVILAEFWDEAGAGCFYTGKSHEQLISRTKPVFDASVPSGNALTAHLLLRLHYLTGKENYLERAEQVLHAYYEAMENQPFGFAHLLCALDFHLQKPLEIALIGAKQSADTRALLEEVHTHYLPNSTLQFAAPGEPLEKISPLLTGKTQLNGKATAYVCRNFTCSAPVTSATELRKLLTD